MFISSVAFLVVRFVGKFYFNKETNSNSVLLHSWWVHTPLMHNPLTLLGII